MAITPWWRSKASRGVEGEPVKPDEMVLEIGGADTFPAFTENLRGVTPGRRAGVRSHLSGGLRRQAPGRPDREVPRHAEGHSPQGTARGQRRVRPGSGRLPRRRRTARGHPQEHLRPARSTRRSRRPRTRSSTSWWMRTISRCPKCSSSGRSRTAWSRRLRAMADEGIDPRSLKLDWDKVKESQREKALREVKASMLLCEDRRAGSHSRHPRRGGPRSGAGRAPAEGTGGGGAHAIREGWHAGPYRHRIFKPRKRSISCSNTPGRRRKRRLSADLRRQLPMSVDRTITYLRSTLLRKPVQVIIETKSIGGSLPPRTSDGGRGENCLKRAGSDDALRCSFCHKSQDVVGKLISSPSDYPRAYICDECIAVCNSILEDDKVEPPRAPRTRFLNPWK